MAWWLPLVGAAVKAGAGLYSGAQQSARTKTYATKLQNLANVTPTERDYIKRQREISEGGDPLQNQLMQEQMNRVVGNIRQTGAERMQQTEGSIIRQGMESSIVAAELRRKTGGETMRNIAEQSRRISAENRYAQERTKRGAEERMMQMQMSVEGRQRQADMQAAGIRAGIPSRGERNLGALTSIATAGFGAYGDYLGQKQQQDWRQQQQEWKMEQIKAGRGGYGEEVTVG